MNEVQIPLYRSYKTVRAFKIEAVIPRGKGHAVLIPVQEDLPHVEVSEEYLIKHQPKAGGYYVRYKDGYESWSPAEAFENGYTLVGEI